VNVLRLGPFLPVAARATAAEFHRFRTAWRRASLAFVGTFVVLAAARLIGGEPNRKGGNMTVPKSTGVPAGPVESFGKAKIIVYAKGEKKVLDPASPHFRALQLACEDLIEHSSGKMDSPGTVSQSPTTETLKKRGWAVELVYDRPVSRAKLGFARDFSSFMDIRQFLIPLAGEPAGVGADGEPAIRLYPSETVHHLGGKTEIIDWNRAHKCQPATTRSVARVRQLLKEWKIDVP